jgi:hypothetical protein
MSAQSEADTAEVPGAASRKPGGILRCLFGIDVRSLALFRVMIAIALLGDLLNRARDLEAHYADTGVLPRDVLISEWASAGHISLHLMNGSVAGQAMLFSLAAALALCLLVGFRTRVAAFGSWALLMSLHIRNPLVLHGWDDLLRMLLFWGLFVPLGAAFSVDAAGGRDPGRDKLHLSVGGAALLLQVAGVYLVTAVLKSSAAWSTEGSAMLHALQSEQFAGRWSWWLTSHPHALKAIAFGVFAFEALGPVLLFSPVAHIRLRLLALGGFLALHLGLFFCTPFGIFPFVSVAALAPFLPPEGWGRLPAGFAALADRLRAVLRSLAVLAGRFGTGAPRPTFPTSRLSNAAAAFFLFVIALENLGSLPRLAVLAPDRLSWVHEAFRLDQLWNMFAPASMKEDGWYVMPGLLESGREVDVYNSRETPVSWVRPPLIIDTYRNDRWQTYLWHLGEKDYSAYLQPYAQYLCRTWNRQRRPGERLRQFRIYLMSTPVVRREVDRPIKPVLLSDHRCACEGSPERGGNSGDPGLISRRLGASARDADLRSECGPSQ